MPDQPFKPSPNSVPHMRAKHLGAWAGVAAYVVYQELVNHWPQGWKEWILFGLKMLAVLAGGFQSAKDANKVPA